MAITNLYEIASKCKDLRGRLEEEIQGFPYLSCDGATARLHNELGCLIVSGFYHGPVKNSYKDLLMKLFPEEEIKLGNKLPHKISYHPESKLFIDLTSDQFHPNDGPIILIPHDDLVLAFSIKEVQDNKTFFQSSEMYLVSPKKGRRINTLKEIGSFLPQRYIEAKARAA